MAAHPPFRERRRARPGSLDRPVNSRMYRGTWLLVGIPLLIAAFTVFHPQPLPAPTLQPDFDGTTARLTAEQFANNNPIRVPGTPDARRAANWVARRLDQYGLELGHERFHAKIPGRGNVELDNLIAVRQGRSNQLIVVVAHRDNTGTSPGANDNGSGTAALLELARSYATPQAPPHPPQPNHTILFLSSDAGAFGGLGVEHFITHYRYRDRVVAVVDLDSIAGDGRPHIVFSGDTPKFAVGHARPYRRGEARRADRRGAHLAARVLAVARPGLPAQPVRAGAVRRARRSGRGAHLGRRPPASGVRRHSRPPQRRTVDPNRPFGPVATRSARRRRRARRGDLELHLPRRSGRPRLGDRADPVHRHASGPRGDRRPVRAPAPAGTFRWRPLCGVTARACSSGSSRCSCSSSSRSSARGRPERRVRSRRSCLPERSGPCSRSSCTDACWRSAGSSAGTGSSRAGRWAKARSSRARSARCSCSLSCRC